MHYILFMNREDLLDVSLCVSCMDRNHNLEIALQTWLLLPVKEILIVDWSCKKPLDYLLKKDHRIKVIRVNGQKYYHHSAANNLKIKYARNTYILATDADVMINDLFFESHELKENIFYKGHGHTTIGTFGVFLGRKKEFDAIGGFNEKLCYGWGYEDEDMYNRLENIDSITIRMIERQYLIHIPHSNELRTENQEYKKMMYSRRNNLKTSERYKWSSKDKKRELHEVLIPHTYF